MAREHLNLSIYIYIYIYFIVERRDSHYRGHPSFWLLFEFRIFPCVVYSVHIFHVRVGRTKGQYPNMWIRTSGRYTKFSTRIKRQSAIWYPRKISIALKPGLIINNILNFIFRKIETKLSTSFLMADSLVKLMKFRFK